MSERMIGEARVMRNLKEGLCLGVQEGMAFWVEYLISAIPSASSEAKPAADLCG